MDPNIFLEAAAFGYNDVISRGLDEGVDVNFAHPLNSWTALHWAAKRNQVNTVKLLLAKGADLKNVTKKGEYAFQLTSNEEIVALLKPGDVEVVQKSQPVQTKGNSVLPFYLREPICSRELDAAEKAIEEKKSSLPIFHQERQELQHLSHNEKNEMCENGEENVGKTFEIFVFRNTADEDSILGSVMGRSTDSIKTLSNAIKQQLDDIPESFRLFKCSSKGLNVPINSKQYDLTVEEILGSCDKVIVKDP